MTIESEHRGPMWVNQAVAAEPRLPLMGPYMVYLVLMMFTEFFPSTGPLSHVAIVLHVIGAFWATLLLRHHWPRLGRPEWLISLIVGLFAAAMWVAGQHWLSEITVAGVNLGGSLGLSGQFPFIVIKDPDPDSIRIISDAFTGSGFWFHVVLKITRAVTIVPIVEELFWRGFILRAFINWDRFEDVPLGRFTWMSFLGSSLLSVLQHPANWGVSILCWMLFNAVFCWKKSLLCLMLTHAITNLALYIYVVKAGDWQFW